MSICGICEPFLFFTACHSLLLFPHTHPTQSVFSTGERNSECNGELLSERRDLLFVALIQAFVTLSLSKCSSIRFLRSIKLIPLSSTSLTYRNDFYSSRKDGSDDGEWEMKNGKWKMKNVQNLSVLSTGERNSEWNGELLSERRELSGGLIVDSW